MTSHDLARLLLTLPDLHVALHVHGHTYMSELNDRTHGPVRVARLETYGSPHVVIGNMGKKAINPPNWYISEWLANPPKYED